MREILFRGKSIINNEWVDGDMYRRTDVFGQHETIIFQDKGADMFRKYHIDPETVCQYTGLQDKNGKKIFENDIVGISDVEHDIDGIYRVIFSEEDYEWGIERESEFWYVYFPLSKVSRYREALEAVGNIFDNPDLITYEKGAGA